MISNQLFNKPILRFKKNDIFYFRFLLFSSIASNYGEHVFDRRKFKLAHNGGILLDVSSVVDVQSDLLSGDNMLESEQIIRSVDTLK